MTDAEFLALRVGDVVERRRTSDSSKHWDACTVTLQPTLNIRDLWFIRLRRCGRIKYGNQPCPSTVFYQMDRHRLRLVRKHDPLTANVFSDWLEEQGFIDAANALRKAFPLATLETESP